MKEVITAVFVLILLGLQISVFLPNGATEKFIGILGTAFNFLKCGLLVGLLIMISIIGLVVPIIGHLIYVAILFVGIRWIIQLVFNSKEVRALDNRISRWTDEELGEDK